MVVSAARSRARPCSVNRCTSAATRAARSLCALFTRAFPSLSLRSVCLVVRVRLSCIHTVDSILYVYTVQFLCVCVYNTYIRTYSSSSSSSETTTTTCCLRQLQQDSLIYAVGVCAYALISSVCIYRHLLLLLLYIYVGCSSSARRCQSASVQPSSVCVCDRERERSVSWPDTTPTSRTYMYIHLWIHTYIYI